MAVDDVAISCSIKSLQLPAASSVLQLADSTERAIFEKVSSLKDEPMDVADAAAADARVEVSRCDVIKSMFCSCTIFVYSAHIKQYVSTSVNNVVDSKDVYLFVNNKDATNTGITTS